MAIQGVLTLPRAPPWQTRLHDHLTDLDEGGEPRQQAV